MVKTPQIQIKGQELSVPEESAPVVELTYTQAKQLMKSLRPPPSDKQKQHTAKLVEMNRQKWQQKTEQKMKKIEEEEKEKELTHQKVVVKPKRVYKNVLVKKMIQPKEEIEYVEQVDDDEEEQEEIIEEVVRRPKKKVIRKVVEESSEDDEIIQKTKKASKIVEAVSKLDNAIQGLKQNNKYAGMLNGIKF